MAKISIVSKPYQQRGYGPKIGRSVTEEKLYLLLVYKSAFTVPNYGSMINNEATVAWCDVTSAFT
jgi:hypothetical protein